MSKSYPPGTVIDVPAGSDYHSFADTGQFILNDCQKQRADEWIKKQRDDHPSELGEDPAGERFGFFFIPSHIACDQVFVVDRKTNNKHRVNDPKDFENL